MKVSVSSRTLSIDSKEREELCSRIYFALSRFSPHMREVKAELEEIESANRELQHHCRLSVKTKQMGHLVFESLEDELMKVVSNSALQAARKIQRMLAHERDRSRWSKL